MHPAARVFTIAVVVVLICSHLVLNVLSEKPGEASLHHGTMRQAGVEPVNEKLMNRIGDMKMEDEDLDLAGDGASSVKAVVEDKAADGKEQTPDAKPVEVTVVDGESVRDDEVDVDVEQVERKDDGEDCEGGDGDGEE